MGPDTRPQETYLQTAPSRRLKDPVDEVPVIGVLVIEDPAPPTSAPEQSLTSLSLKKKEVTHELVASCLRRAGNPPITGKRDFKGKRVHVVQIGLGTNATFIQNVASPYYEGWDKGIEWILQCVSSAVIPSTLTGVAVELILRASVVV